MTITEGTPQRLYVMQTGTATVPTPNGPLAMSAGCYLVQMSDGRNILIDSGTPAEMPIREGVPSIVQGKDVIAQLADLGLRPDDISLLITTHFDIDHVGQHEAFTAAEIVAQREAYDVARGGHPRFTAARPHWDHPALRYRLVDGDTELLPGLTLIETSGHAPAHQSVLVRLPQTGPVLLAIDAVSFGRAFTPDRHATPVDDNEEQLRASTRKLLALVERKHVALVVFHHDGEQWQTLRLAPAYYD